LRSPVERGHACRSFAASDFDRIANNDQLPRGGEPGTKFRNNQPGRRTSWLPSIACSSSPPEPLLECAMKRCRVLTSTVVAYEVAESVFDNIASAITRRLGERVNMPCAGACRDDDRAVRQMTRGRPCASAIRRIWCPAAARLAPIARVSCPVSVFLCDALHSPSDAL
jgi:hypothetical protein